MDVAGLTIIGAVVLTVYLTQRAWRAHGRQLRWNTRWRRTHARGTTRATVEDWPGAVRTESPLDIEWGVPVDRRDDFEPSADQMLPR
jgi:hypothetical protein